MTNASYVIAVLLGVVLGWIVARLLARSKAVASPAPTIEPKMPAENTQSDNVNLSFEEDDLPLNASDADPRAVGLLYATNRAAAPDYSGSWFSGERSHEIRFGRAFVRVPEAHSAGHLEHPLKIKIWRLELYQFARDPKKHFVIRSVQAMTREEWCDLVRKFPSSDAMVFVHGFNTSFEEALYRHAQIVWDLQFKGVNVLFSWPSRGGAENYIYDKDSALGAREAFITVLSLLKQQPNIKSLHVVAHSMGNLVALESLAYHPHATEPLNLSELVMAAPDVDRDNFKTLIPRVAKAGAGLTLYASSADWALTLSKKLAGSIPRAGDVPLDGPVLVPGLDSIDVTALGTDFFGLNHGTYAQARSVINDMGLLFSGHVRPPSKRLPEIRGVPENVEPPSYWRYPD
jgi:esterase/lipase superfamily enzyme